MVVVLVLVMIASCVHDTVQTAKPLIQHYFQHENYCSKIVCTSFTENIFAAVLQRFITRFVVNMKNQYQTKGSRDFELLYGDNKIIFFRDFVETGTFFKHFKNSLNNHRARRQLNSDWLYRATGWPSILYFTLDVVNYISQILDDDI